MNVDYNPASISVNVGTESASISPGALIVRDVVERDPYTGAYSVTPGDEAVILDTKNLRMTDNITINPVPSTYCHIAWDGSSLTVY